MSQSPRRTNRLIDETSPYLLQHAHNPVDWYPWGLEAFEIARKEDKPIFLSVGYSTCYWCHVMERQSFENEAIAAEMNRLFVNIKVDREERPDVDQLYMTAVQVLTRQGGWPMSVFLTPQLEPFYGGTYFPPTDAYGRPGFLTLIRALEEAYRERREDVRRSTTQLVEILRQLAEPRRPSRHMKIDPAWVDELLDRILADYDPVHGGFGAAPKFPRETELELILTHNAFAPNARRMEQLAHTLDAMADGGIHDQLGGGFHRYSTDAHWLVPHFEIMLYDNAMLGWVYAEASRQLGEPRYANVARGIFDFILREMTSPSGAFYTAFDAEVDAKEGENYLWTAEEVKTVLHERGFGDADYELFAKVYGLDRGPNFADPHHGDGTPEKNILFLPNPLRTMAASLGTDVEWLEKKLYPMRSALYAVRLKRKQPLLDTKILTSWNALMIRGLAHGGVVLDEPRYVEAAAKGARFLLDHHRAADGSLRRTSRDGSPAKFDAFLDDYAFLADALLALDKARPDAGWRKEAESLAGMMMERFGAAGSACYYTSSGAEDLIVRQMVGSDSPLPSGNGVAARVLLALGRSDAARDLLAAFGQSLHDHAESMAALLQAAALYVHEHGSLTISPAAGVETELPRETSEKVVTVEARWTNSRELLLELKIADGYHINSHTAAKDLIATVILVTGAKVDYPRAVHRRFDFADGYMSVYEGDVTTRVTFDSPPTEQVNVRLTYQPCTETACLAPVTHTIRVDPPLQ